MVPSLFGWWARWRRGSLASPLAAVLCVYFVFFFFYPYLLALAAFVRPLRVPVYLLLFVCRWVCGMCVFSWRWCALRRRVVPSFQFDAGVPHTMLLSVRAA